MMGASVPTGEKRILITGGETFLGLNIAVALLAEGADVTVLVRPESRERLGILAQRVRVESADVWDSASLRGRARGHRVVIHTVGSMVADPARGLTYHRLNVMSARHVANMCISDGVQRLIFLSSTQAPWISRHYVQTKREAESYLRRIGLTHTVIRAPLAYPRGLPRPLFFRLMSALLGNPPLAWLGGRGIAPMPADILARAIARIALLPTLKAQYYGGDLYKLNTRAERRGIVAMMSGGVMEEAEHLPFEIPEEELPFGWKP